MSDDSIIRLKPLVHTEDAGMSRILLLGEVIKVMNIPEKKFREWNKTAAPSPITRESLLVDTLIAKGWRLTIQENKEPNETCDTDPS